MIIQVAIDGLGVIVGADQRRCGQDYEIENHCDDEGEADQRRDASDHDREVRKGHAWGWGIRWLLPRCGARYWHSSSYGCGRSQLH